ncbi:hypothetical protein VRK_02590 [Vibrio sp. MEBiC08052]|nr:hypothetical protein VRK_02590 [Vibrio sp. MEBiC08052]
MKLYNVLFFSYVFLFFMIFMSLMSSIYDIGFFKEEPFSIINGVLLFLLLMIIWVVPIVMSVLYQNIPYRVIFVIASMMFPVLLGGILLYVIRKKNRDTLG